MMDFTPLTKTVHDALIALGTAAAILPQAKGARRMDDWGIDDLPHLYKIVAKSMLVGYEINLETLFLTSRSGTEEAERLKAMLSALGPAMETSESKRCFSELSAELLGGNWEHPDGPDYRQVDEAAKYRLADQVQNLDWCNKIWSQLFQTGTNKIDIADYFTTIFMTGMRARCPIQEFPSQWWMVGNVRTLDELEVIYFSARIRRTLEWRKHLRDENTVSKWRDEAYARGMTPSMFDFMLAELCWFAEEIDLKTGIDHATVPGVFFSDSLVSAADCDMLRSGAELLSEVPESEKDWRPKSDGRVLDLVDPNMYPYIRGRSALLQRLDDSQASSTITSSDTIVSHRERVASSILRFLHPGSRHGSISSPQSSLLLIGRGAPISLHMPGLNIVQRKWSGGFPSYQWLPVDVEVSQGTSPSVRFLSYINNLRPGSLPGEKLYPVLEMILARFIPLFERTLTETRRRRTENEGVRLEFLNGPVQNYQNYWNMPVPPSAEDLPDEVMDEYLESREFLRPTVAPFNAPGHVGTAQVTLCGRTLQVVVKMENIHLTPEKPAYEGGLWHLEGTSNEQIVATGVYYYQAENLGKTSLQFRQAVEEPLYVECELDDMYIYDHLKNLYGMFPDCGSPTNQYLGEVRTPEGRCICFPNSLQRRLSPVKLKDPAKPGHCKTLTFFLVDPSQRIISTSDVPPQQLEWFLQELRIQGGTRLSTLPLELFNMVCKYTQADVIPIRKPDENKSEDDESEDDESEDDESEDDEVDDDEVDERPWTGVMAFSEAMKHRLTIMDGRVNFGIDTQR